MARREAHPAAGPAEPDATAGAQKAYTTWPAYRVSQGELRSFQWRLNDCFRQQRFPELIFASDASIALTMFLARNANGAAFDAPAIKR
jgi:sulfur-oxidizing protein SoxA